jgi:hypothetical protein
MPPASEGITEGSAAGSKETADFVHG